MLFVFSQLRSRSFWGLTVALLATMQSAASAQLFFPNPASGLTNGAFLRTREEQPLIEEPFFDGLGVEVELTVQEAATPAESWFALAPQSVSQDAGIALSNLELSFIGTTGKTGQRLAVNAVVQNQSYLSATQDDVAQVLLMEGDRVVAQQILEQPIAPGQAVAVQYQLNGQRPMQPWSLRYQVSDETVELYPAESEAEARLRPVIPEMQERDLRS